MEWWYDGSNSVALYLLMTLNCHCVFRYVYFSALGRGVEDIHCEDAGAGEDVRCCVVYMH